MIPTIQKINANLEENSKIANVSKKCKTNCRNFQFYKEKAGMYADSLLKYSKENKKKTLAGSIVAAVVLFATVGYVCKSKQVEESADKGKYNSDSKKGIDTNSNPSTSVNEDLREKGVDKEKKDPEGEEKDKTSAKTSSLSSSDVANKGPNGMIDKKDDDEDILFLSYMSTFRNYIKKVVDFCKGDYSKLATEDYFWTNLFVDGNFITNLFRSREESDKKSDKKLEEFGKFIHFLQSSQTIANSENYKKELKRECFKQFVELIQKPKI
ncbi:MAG: hypothetical protein FWC41_05670 [Firmicutes bacterium]|nr:hypothetical protein [Bacillota bacterium]